MVTHDRQTASFNAEQRTHYLADRARRLVMLSYFETILTMAEELMQQHKSIETFIKKMGLIPFNGPVELKLFDLMQMVEIQPGRDARIVPMAAGFTDKIFAEVKSTKGQTDLGQLFSSVEESTPEDFVGVYEETNVTSGDIAASLLKGTAGGGGKGGTSSEKKAPPAGLSATSTPP